MSPADHSVVCSRGGPPRCKYAHDQWTPDSHKKALEKEQKEMKNKSTTETNTRQNKTKKSNFKAEKKNRKKVKNLLTAPSDTQERAQRRNSECARTM